MHKTYFEDLVKILDKFTYLSYDIKNIICKFTTNKYIHEIVKYDYIIVGAGIAGLYAYGQLSNIYDNVLILESSDRIGGRIGQDLFYDKLIATGAGIGRKSKDVIFQKLLKECEIEVKEFKIKKRWLTEMQENESKQIVEHLQNSYDEKVHKGKTFKEYSILILGKIVYNKFIKHFEYTDMENEDVYETLFYYGLEDNNNDWIGLYIGWNKLLDKMKPRNYVLNHKVKNIKKGTNSWCLDGIYHTKNIILATTIHSVRKLLKKHDTLYSQVESQPFIRVYAKFDTENALKMKEATQSIVTVVNNQLKKIIPISEDIYMIVYSDNTSATYIKNHIIADDEKSRRWLCNKLKQVFNEDFEIISIRDYYWEEGTHYYKPFLGDSNYENWVIKAQNPEKGLYVAGEMISRDQGWVEGALQSVDSLMQIL